MAKQKGDPRAVKQTEYLLEILRHDEMVHRYVYLLMWFLQSTVGKTEEGEIAVRNFSEKKENVGDFLYTIAEQTFLEMSSKKRKKLIALYHGGVGWQFHEALSEVYDTMFDKAGAVFESSSQDYFQ